MENTPKRLAPELALPEYSYVPGKFPHPISDPQGHSYGVEAPDSVSVDDALVDCEQLRWGIDLFNHGYYWEAHEAWEHVWIALGRKGDEANIIKAMIKLAAAGVKSREGRLRGVASHARRAIELIDEVAQRRDKVAQIRLSSLRRLAQSVIDAKQAMLDERDVAVAIVMPSRIEPGE